MMDSEIVETIKIYFKICAPCVSIWFLGYFNFSVTFVIVGVFAFVIKCRKMLVQRGRSSLLQSMAKDEKASLLTVYKDLPSWVIFHDVEKAEWLNKIVKQMWPFIVDYAVNLLEKDISKIVRDSLPQSLLPFKFTKLNIGDICPRIGGIKVFSGPNIKREEIVMDIDISYYGDCDISMKVKYFEAGIKNVEIKGMMHIVIKPLVPQIPIVGAISACFINNPSISFDLTGLGNIVEIPGLSDALHSIIRSEIAKRLVLPNRIVIPLIKDVDIASLQYPIPQGICHITAVAASDLKAADIGLLTKGKSDPYVVIEIGAQEFKTKTISNSLSPTWNESFEAVMMSRDCQEITFSVYDSDPGPNKDDFLGSTSIDIESVAKQGTIDVWKHLEFEKETSEKLGSIHLRLQWLNLSQDPLDFQNKTKALESVEKLHDGFLHCILDSCKNLPSVKHAEEPSPMVILQCAGVTQQSTVADRTPSPVYEQAFHFLIDNPHVDTLVVKVVDSKTKKELGNALVPMKLLISEPGMQLRRAEPYRLKDCAKPDAVVNLRLSLRSLTAGPVSLAVPPMPDVDLDETDDGKPETARRSRTPTQVSTDSSDAGVVESPIEPVSLSALAAGRPQPAAPEDTGLRRRVPPQLEDSVAAASATMGRIELALRYSTSRTCLAVVVLKAEGLVALDEDGLSDPYVKLSIMPKEICPVVKRTQVKKNQLAPVFDETFEFPISVSDLSRCTLRAEVKNHVGMSLRARKKSMGVVDVDNLDKLVSSGTKTSWYVIRSKEASTTETLL